MNYEIITRRDALNKGYKRFYTGRVCTHGHISQRFVSTGNCVQCGAERSKQFAGEANRMQRAVMMGHFVYPLHPDDHAAAMAYCQALDLGRGRVPTVTTAPAAPPPVDIEAIRTRAFGAHLIPPTPGPRTLDPSMAAQLREAGLLK